MPGPTRSFRALTPRQRALLVLTLLALPLLALFGVEAALRLGGYGSAYPLFVPFEEAPEYLVPNPAVAGRYFRYQSGVPAPPLDLFRAEKSPGGYRIFVQGGSSAAGFPYFHGGAFSRMLEQRLQVTFPDREIEVVNTALDATNSYALLDLAPEIIAQRPDAVLLYTGHNEYYGVLGVASAESGGRVPGLVRTYLALRKLRTVQLLQSATDAAAGLLWRITGRSTPPLRTLMEYLASEHDVRYASPLYRAGVSQFDRNLDALLRTYADAGVPVFVGTLASNERGQPPFLSRPVASVDTSRWQRLLRHARVSLDRGDAAAATASIDSALALDPTAGDPYFLRGRVLDRLPGRHDEARLAYRAARDRDQLPFRAPADMNAVIRETAGEHDAVVVETLDALAAASPDGIIDDAVMLEHLHPNIDGQFLLANAFYEALREAGEIGAWGTPVPRQVARARVPVTAVDSIAGAYMVARLTARFPFAPTGTGGSPMDTLRPGTRVEQIALAYHRRELPWIRVMGELQEHYASRGEWDAVARVNLVAAQELAHSPVPLHLAGRAAHLAGRQDDALRHLLAAEARRPSAEGAMLLGHVLATSGDAAAARRQYEAAVRLDPGDRRASAALQALRAIPGLERAAAEAPEDVDTMASLGATYFLTGQYARAAEMAERVLRLRPDHPAGNRLSSRLEAVYRNVNE